MPPVIDRRLSGDGECDGECLKVAGSIETSVLAATLPRPLMDGAKVVRACIFARGV